MKKLWIPMILIILLLTGCSSNSKVPQKIKYENIETISIKATPESPAIKTVKNTTEEAQQFDAIIDFVNKIEKEPVEQKDESKWQFVVEMKGKENHTITFIGDKVKYDKTWYKTKSMYVGELEKLFNNIKAKALYEK